MNDTDTSAARMVEAFVGDLEAKGHTASEIQDALFAVANRVAASRWPDPDDEPSEAR